MTLSTRIAPHLPYLRRYSRALTGTQTSGDAYVAAVLEAIIADLSIFPDTANDRVALYKLFTQLFGSTAVQIPEPTSPYAWEQRATLNLSKVSPRARQAFLLASVENFRVAEIAEILETEERDVMEMAKIGPGIAGGNNRQTLTDADAQGRSLFKKWCDDAGLTMGVDRMQTAPQRVANYLLTHCIENGATASLRLPFPKNLLARKLGLAPEALSRAFSALKTKGVTVRGRAIAVRDVKVLRQI